MIGSRPIDLHVKGFKALGADVDISYGLISAKADHLVGSHIYMDKVSVGATINVLMAAALAEGKTVIENAAKEPHVVDVANFLNSMGANIRGAGYGCDPYRRCGKVTQDILFCHSGSDRGGNLYVRGSSDQWCVPDQK